MNRPVRKLRRFIRRSYERGKGFKGKSKGRGKARHAYLAEMTDYDVDQVFFGGKGKGGGKNRSSGKGKGRKKNPIGRDGERMLCSTCGSDEHFRAECPRNNGGQFGGLVLSGIPDQLAIQDGPLGDLLQPSTAPVVPLHLMNYTLANNSNAPIPLPPDTQVPLFQLNPNTAPSVPESWDQRPGSWTVPPASVPDDYLLPPWRETLLLFP